LQDQDLDFLLHGILEQHSRPYLLYQHKVNLITLSLV
jgi:hypothetical protein